MDILAQPQANSNLSVMARARLARQKEIGEARWQAARALCDAVNAIVAPRDIAAPDSVDWAHRDGKSFPIYRIFEDGLELVFSYYSDEPGLYQAATCASCSQPTRFIVKCLADVARAVDVPQLCGKCQATKAEGGW